LLLATITLQSIHWVNGASISADVIKVFVH